MKVSLKQVGTGLLAVLIASVLVWAQATQPADKAADKPVEKKPAVVSPAAQGVLNDLRDTYVKLKSLELAGKVGIDLDAGGEKRNDSSEFTSSFQAPEKFRHDMKDDMLIVNTADKAIVYKSDIKKYITVDPVKERTTLSELPDPPAGVLEQQNPSLAMALVKDAGADLVQGAETVELDNEVSLDGTAFQALVFKGDGVTKRILVDPKTHLIRQVSVDVKDRLVQKGVPQVNKAIWTVDYTTSKPDATMVAGAFEWTPPADAMLVKLPVDAAPGATSGQDAALALEGKPAPDFKLKDLSGADVTLASQKGKVVVVDFWATWCGPCVESLPHLSTISTDLAPKGLKVFAIDLRETKAQVQKFVDDHKLKMTVLLDGEGEVGDSYKVNGIPQTVIVGKDGNVKKVFIGFGPGSEKLLRDAIEAALKE